jgi:hypothetical protein
MKNGIIVLLSCVLFCNQPGDEKVGMSLPEAWSHAKALWPNVCRLELHDGSGMACFKNSTMLVGPMWISRIEPGIVDWPEGVTIYDGKQAIQHVKPFHNPATAEDYETMHDYMDGSKLK